MDRRSRRWLLAMGVVLLAGAAGLAARAVGAHHDRDRLMRADPEAILKDADLAPVALSLGREGFERHCAACHGAGKGDARRGIPDLTDGDFLYGEGGVAEIETIILHGIRAGDSKGWDLAAMPAYASEHPYPREKIPPLQPAQLADVTQFLMQMHGRAKDQAAAGRGKLLFKGNGACWDCHGPDGGGDAAIGAPNLADDIWLYGDGSAASVARSIAYGRAGRSPAFARTISAADARAIAVYVASLSRGGVNGNDHGN